MGELNTAKARERQGDLSDLDLALFLERERDLLFPRNASSYRARVCLVSWAVMLADGVNVS